jgi:hypothetical protein
MFEIEYFKDISKSDIKMVLIIACLFGQFAWLFIGPPIWY